MTDLPDWAGTVKAAYRDQLLAEVRRVVEDVQKSIWGAPSDTGSAVTLCCHEILTRLNALVTSSNSKDSLCVEDLLDGLPRTTILFVNRDGSEAGRIENLAAPRLSTENEVRGIVDGKLVKMREIK